MGDYYKCYTRLRLKATADSRLRTFIDAHQAPYDDSLPDDPSTHPWWEGIRKGIEGLTELIGKEAANCLHECFICAEWPDDKTGCFTREIYIDHKVLEGFANGKRTTCYQLHTHKVFELLKPYLFLADGEVVAKSYDSYDEDLTALWFDAKKGEFDYHRYVNMETELNLWNVGQLTRAPVRQRDRIY